RYTRFSRDWSSDVCSSDLHFIKALLQTGFVFIRNGGKHKGVGTGIEAEYRRQHNQRVFQKGRHGVMSLLSGYKSCWPDNQNSRTAAALPRNRIRPCFWLI